MIAISELRNVQLRLKGTIAKAVDKIAAEKAWNKEYQRVRRKVDPVYAMRSREAGIRHQAGQRAEVLAAYGNSCTCCGEARPVFLTIDHIDGGGTAHRKKLGGSGTTMTRWLLKNECPRGFQVMCFNCNNAKFRGGCPHVDEGN